jgi:pilus assembly protein CpaC
VSQSRVRSIRCRCVALALGVAALLLGQAGATQARDRTLVEMEPGARTEGVVVAVGKTRNVHTGVNFVDVIVGDPETADVVPLTDHSLSILGKKVGTTRVSVYGEGKHLVGIFDIEVSYDAVKLGEELARRFPRARLRVSTVNGRIMLSGTVPDGPTLDRALMLTRQFSPEVIDSVVVDQAQEVLLEVRFIEIQRSASRELGVSWDVLGKDVQASFGTSALLSSSTPVGTVFGTLLKNGVQADAIIRALEQRQVARRLAEPNLVALSGETANFLAGGEFPFPVQNNMGQISVDFKRYGVGLAFTPTVLGDGLINLKIIPEVSQLDPTNTVQIGTVSIPSLIVRRANTTVELRDGQSFAIGGLLQNNNQTQQQQLPWIGDVPVLGTLFRSALYQKNETDLVIIVTPHLVRPTRPGDTVRVPTDNSLMGNDADLFLYGQPEVDHGIKQRVSGVRPAPVGHILDLPQ